MDAASAFRTASSQAQKQHPRRAATRPAAAATATAAVTEAPAELPLQSAASPASTPRPSSSPETTPFVWHEHWWPLMPVAYLRTDRPTPVMLLGTPLVVWRDASGAWRVFKDQCPHRMAPLSEGRVEADGTLSCSYHGWRFEGGGACTRIPQAVDAAAEATACGSRRSCASAYPARVEAGMLWVWPSDAPGAPAAASAAQPVITNSLREKARDLEAATAMAQAAAEAGGRAAPRAPRPFDWYMRELPYSYEVLLENLLDPSHLPFSHHGLNDALHRSKGGPMPMTQPGTSAGGNPQQQQQEAPQAAAPVDAAEPPPHWGHEHGPDAEFAFAGNISKDASLSLTAPHLVTYTYKTSPHSSMLIELYATPVAPGRSRFFAVMSGPPKRKPGAPPPPKPRLQNLSLKVLPTILTFLLDPILAHHLMMNKLLDGDSVFLHMQDKTIRSMEPQLRSGAGASGTLPVHSPVAAQHAASPQQGGEPPLLQQALSHVATAGSAAGQWSRLYFIPTQADNMVLAGRRWLEERAGGGPFTAAAAAASGGAAAASGAGGHVDVQSLLLAPTGADRRQLLDRFNQHTRHCPACTKRLNQLQGLQKLLRAVQAAAFLGVCVAAGAAGAALSAAAAVAPAAAAPATTAAALGWPAGLAAACGAVASLAQLLLQAMREMAQKMVFVDYVHAEHD